MQAEFARQPRLFNHNLLKLRQFPVGKDSNHRVFQRRYQMIVIRELSVGMVDAARLARKEILISGC